MAETQTPTPTPTPPPAKGEAKKPRFQIRTPNPVFGDERYGIKFRDGVGDTDSPTRAHACLELGYLVVDGKDKNPPEPRFKLKHKSKDFREEVAGVPFGFGEGVGFTGNAAKAAECMRRGCACEDQHAEAEYPAGNDGAEQLLAALKKEEAGKKDR